MLNKIVTILIFVVIFKMTNAQVAIPQLNETSFCGINNTLTVTDISTGANTRTWNVSGPGGFTSVSSTNITENIVLTEIGIYVVALEACDLTATCDDSVRTVYVNELPTAVITMNDTIVCYGTTVNINASNSIYNTADKNFYWDTDYNTGIDETSEYFTFLANSDKTIMLIIEDDNGCIDSAFQNLYIVQNEEANFNIEQSYCVGTPINLVSYSTVDNSSLDSIFWLIDSTTFIVGENVWYTHPIVDTIQILHYVVNDFGCSDGIQKYIRFETPISVSINIGDTTVCEGTPVNLSGIGSTNYEWDINIIKETPTRDTKYTFIGLSETDACPPDSASVIISEILSPEVIFEVSTYTPVISSPVDIKLTHDPQFSIQDHLLWLDHNTSNVLENEIGFENHFIAEENVSFPVQLVFHKEEYTCTLDTFVSFEVNDECTKEKIYITNVFTPNKDGLNDVFEIKGYTILNITEFIIFDRSGMEVFFEENIEFNNGVSLLGWDGNNKNGELCNSGVFVYYYKAVCKNGGDIAGSGNVTLLR